MFENASRASIRSPQRRSKFEIFGPADAGRIGEVFLTRIYRIFSKGPSQSVLPLIGSSLFSSSEPVAMRGTRQILRSFDLDFSVPCAGRFFL